jgi:hypothetical protein
MNQKLLIAEVRAHWREFNSEELEGCHIDREKLATLLSVRYGFCRDRALRESERFLIDFAERIHRRLLPKTAAAAGAIERLYLSSPVVREYRRLIICLHVRQRTNHSSRF